FDLISISKKKIQSNLLDIKQMNQLFHIPNIPYFTRENFGFNYVSPSKYNPESIIGQIMLNQRSNPFGISLKDFSKGGIICGAIGTGKTNLRLHILNLLLLNNVRIIDFDIKGDAPKYRNIRENGIVLIPNLNFSFNPFICPSGISKKKYSSILYRIFLEAISQNEIITPPQKYLLSQAISYTVEFDGNCKSFLENLLLFANIEKEIIDNLQESSALALISKLNWIKDSLKEVFWFDSNVLNSDQWRNSSLFFDLSVVKESVPIHLVQFLINLITSRIQLESSNINQIHLDNNDEKEIQSLHNGNQGNTLNTVIFIDEAQLLMPANQTGKLTVLEEILTTLRYRGISVISSGVSAELLSQTLLDTGFISQFRSSSSKLIKSLGFNNSESNLIHSLQPFNTFIYTDSIGGKAIQVQIDKFSFNQDDEIIYLNDIQSNLDQNTLLKEFNFNLELYYRMKIQSFIIDKLTIKLPKREKLVDLISSQLQQNGTILIESILNGNIGLFIESTIKYSIHYFKSNDLLQSCLLYLQECFVHIFLFHQYQPKFKQIKNNLRKLISIYITEIKAELDSKIMNSILNSS
ncbi:MAG: hypothetical protein OEZ01_03180, partial [Candidatus Heimdallarchaeota archaeon]|nr:hypothetical protein [Candidatus Heimdallarchaeota archaeon]